MTCGVNAAVGDENYCGPTNSNSTSNELRDFVASSPSNTNWGWCDDDCPRRREHPSSFYLMRTTVKVVDDHKCV